jgi:lysine 2,3-aminomutase
MMDTLAQENNDWRWQLRNSISSVNKLNQVLPFSWEREEWLKNNYALNDLPFLVTPHFVSLMDGSPFCPIFRQVISSNSEHNIEDFLMLDPLGEEEREKVPHLIHRYPDRVLFLPTDRCASYCRFCQRKRWVGQGPTPKREDHDRAFQYIENNTAIREIIFSGGDPLLLSNERLNYLLKRSFAINHVEIVRFHTRILSFLPMRIDKDLAHIFSNYRPIYFVTHFNHPKEINNETIKAINELVDAKVSLLNQSALLKGINDNEDTLKELFRLLAKLLIRPYYIHQCDLIKGSSHFRVPIKRSLELLANLRGHISGHGIPTLMVDIPGGHGKVPLHKSAIVKEDENFIYLQGFTGGIAAYPKK